MNEKVIIKNVLDEFFGVTKEILDDSSIDGDSFVGLAVDQVDTTILSEAISDALEKKRENTNQ